MSAGGQTDSAVAVAMLRARFPGVPIWFGDFTGRYWAIVVGQLVEAATASDLRWILWILDSFAPARRGL
jgi:hypothetical protein